MSTLDRLRGIVQGRSPVPVVAPELSRTAVRRGGSLDPPIRAAAPDYARAAAVLGGTIREREDGVVLIVDRHYPEHAFHGQIRIGDLADVINDGTHAMSMMAQAWPAAEGIGGSRLLFLDLETTGLFSGAGTQAFLVGCAAIDGRAIHIRQFFLPGFEHERALLNEVEAWSNSHDALVTYNGRTFDAPLIETRFLFHRVACPFEDVPHLDMLHAARRLWRHRATAAGPGTGDDASCSLAVLEKQLAGVHRVGDVPGYEIPSRYFRFIREADVRPLEAVMEHNRLDLLSLAAVLARVITLIDRGPSIASSAQEALGLARIYERAQFTTNAESAFLHTIALASRVGSEPEVHGEALRRLAWIRRRSGRVRDAADAWQQLASLARCPGSLRREAREALAIHHEHRSKDLLSAKQHALELMAEAGANIERVTASARSSRAEDIAVSTTPPAALKRDDETGIVARAALALTAWTERWIPDAFIFALVATLLVFAAALLWTPSTFTQVIDAWGNGFWDLIPFTLQMSLIIITGHVLATSAPMGRAIRAIASWPATPRGAVALVTFFALFTSWFNWGFSLVFSAVLAREVARRVTGVDYRALAAASVLGIGSIWAQGLSGSAALQMATAGALQPQIRDIVSAGGLVAGRHHPVPPHDLPLAEHRVRDCRDGDSHDGDVDGDAAGHRAHEPPAISGSISAPAN